MPTIAAEDYLKRMFVEEQRESDALISTGRIAAALDVTPGTATVMIKGLAKKGLVEYEPYGGARLSCEGRKIAAQVLRRHRLVELFLVEIMELDWSEVHPEAERLEHAISDRLLDRMDEMLGHPATDPHGDPIPNARGELAREDYPSLIQCAMDIRLEVVRILDQSREFLQLMESHHLKPGRRLKVVSRDDDVGVDILFDSGITVELGCEAAMKILVRGL
jgi:DtxR family Mn-dependent transcriptional regulator